MAAFFIVIGVLIMVGTGVLAWFLVADAPNHGARVVVARHGGRAAPGRGPREPGAVPDAVALAVVGVSSQVFLPVPAHLHPVHLRIDAYALVLAVVLIGASAAGVLGGRVIDRVGKVGPCCPRRASTWPGSC